MNRLLVVSLLAGAILVAPPLHADWLVTADGTRIETRGPWKVRDGMVIFKLPDAGLSSLRLEQVNLEASAHLTKAAKAPPPPQPKPEPKKVEPVLVLTDADVQRVYPTDPSEDPTTDADSQPEDTPAGRLDIANWRHEIEQDGIVIRGRLVNAGGQILSRIRLTVALLDAADEVLGTAKGVLTTTILRAEQTSEFHAEFPGIFAFDDVEFTGESLAISAGPQDGGQNPENQTRSST